VRWLFKKPLRRRWRGAIGKPDKNIDRWDLHQFIQVAAHLKLIKPATCTAAKLAQSFRNLIPPGRAARLEQTCDREKALSALAEPEHVIRNLF